MAEKGPVFKKKTLFAGHQPVRNDYSSLYLQFCFDKEFFFENRSPQQFGSLAGLCKSHAPGNPGISKDFKFQQTHISVLCTRSMYYFTFVFLGNVTINNKPQRRTSRRVAPAAARLTTVYCGCGLTCAL